MKYLFTYLRCSLLLIVLLCINISSRASHILGADLFYTWVSGNTYTITLVLYGDCGPSSRSSFNLLSSTVPEICVKRGTQQITTLNLQLQAPTAGVDITPVCPAQVGQTQCQNTSSAIPGIKKFIYSTTYTLPAPTTSNCWQFCYFGNGTGTTSGRTGTITNIQNAGGTTLQLVDTLDNSVHPNNSSTQFTVIPTPFYCNNTPATHNPGCVDPDGDVIDISLIPARNGSGTCAFGGNVTYVAPTNGANPLRVVPGSFLFSSSTGQLNFTPNANQRSTVVYNVREFRAGAFVGSCQREMNFLVQTCTNPPPIGGVDSSIGGIVLDSNTFTICTNSGAFSLFMNPRASNPANTITVTSSGLPTGASINITGNSTIAPQVVFSWTSTGTLPGTYIFYLTYTDNNCPLSGSTTRAITIVITPPPTVSYTVVSAATCAAKAVINVIPSGAGAPWTVDFTGPTPHTVTGVTGSFIDSLDPGTHTITIISSIAGACSSFTTITITTTAPPPDMAATNPCADSTLLLSTTTSVSGMQYSWSGPNGFTSTDQNPIISNVQTNANGIYSLTITNMTTGCVSSNTLNVSIRPTPSVSAIDNATCETFALNLNSSSNLSGTTYSWTGPLGFTSASQNPVISPAVPAQTGVYTVVATLNGCPSPPDTANYTVYPTPQLPVVTHVAYCQKDTTVPLNAIGDSLLWYTTATGGTGSFVTPIPPDSTVGVATWYVSQTINGCEGPRAPVNDTTLYLPVFEIAGIREVCLHDSLTLNYSSSEVLIDPVYVWEVRDTFASTILGNNNNSSVLIKFDTPTTQYVILTASSYGGRCTSTQTIPIDVVEPPLSQFYVKPDLCIGDTVELALSYRAPSATIFTWDFAGATIVASNSNSGGPYSLSWQDTGIHIVQLITTSDIGCITPPVFDTFNVHPYPDARIKTPESVACLEDTIVLSAVVNSYGNTYTWTPEHFFSFAKTPLSNNNSTTLGKIERSGYVTLTVTDAFGCETSNQVYFDPSPCCAVTFPNAFTPNGDNNNDVFRPLFNGFHRFHMFRIVNRWGQTIFETTNSNQSWDGNFNGVPQEIGVYYYYLKYDCGANVLESKGDVTLIR